MQNLLTVATQVAVLFALISVGFACRRTKLLNDVSVRGLVDILILIVTPCLIVDVFQRPYDPEKLGSLGIAFTISVLAHCLAIALATLFIRHKEEKTRVVLTAATVFSNAGFMGIPLEQAILGDEGVFFGIVYVVVFNLFMWSWGLWIMGGRPSVKQMLVNPGTIGLAAGLPLFFMSLTLPEILGKPIHMLAQLNTPVPMIIIGYYLAGAKFSTVVKTPSAWTAGAIRLIVYPLMILAILYPFKGRLDRTMTLAIITAASAPVGAMVSMFAAKYRRDVDTSVGIVSATTLASILTMPLVISLAMAVL